MPVPQLKVKMVVKIYTTPCRTTGSILTRSSRCWARVKPSLDGTLIIEGDKSLELKSLLPTHADNVKCIYIDPPYTTWL